MFSRFVSILGLTYSAAFCITEEMDVAEFQEYEGVAAMDQMTEQILRKRMHGLYLSRGCESITQLSHELLGLHCWFHRNVAFSALIRGARLAGWKTALTKTWLYRGTLHGAVYEDLPLLLGLHAEDPCTWLLGEDRLREIADRVLRLMEDGVYSRAEMRRIFAYDLDEEAIKRVFSPWGGIFVYLARRGKVAFRDMTSRDFDLIDAEPVQSPDDVLPELLRRYFKAYGPATLADAAWFLGLGKNCQPQISARNLEGVRQFSYGGSVYYDMDDSANMGDIPELTLLSGFDPLIVSYADRSAVLPQAYKCAVILKSGICLPTIAVNGEVAGLWNLKKGEPVVTFFETQPKRIRDMAYDLVDEIRRQTAGVM